MHSLFIFFCIFLNNASWSIFQTFEDADIQKLSSTKLYNHFNDPLPSKFLKETSHLLIPLWIRIINASYARHHAGLSKKWTSHTYPKKKPDANLYDPNHFRPISSIPTLAKLLEKCVHQQLCNHIDQHQLLDHCQSGFKPGHSTETAMVHIVADALRFLYHNESCLLILLDLSAAFDTVKHETLLSLLELRMGLSGTVLKWFCSFLQNRSQQVLINHDLSDQTPVTIGVPQGSSLSPTLFSLYMEPLTEILKHSNISYHMYADDAQLYMKITSPNDISTLNNILNKTQHWLTLNHLKLNALKTEFLLISPPNPTSNIKDCLPLLTALNCTPHIVDSAKSLGITLDHNLSLMNHISSTTRGANFHLHVLRKPSLSCPVQISRWRFRLLWSPNLTMGMLPLLTYRK